ncbi:MAG TPA: carbamoyltransferase C-terminal domain-containing protein [Candidatus Binataceae bacterium]|nr:carbamoyltransferase C-terminal domain-containing protein [Candidatus Binataceae bacterium]
MLIIGLNAYHGDASAAAFAGGRLLAAAEEERFNRIKHSAGFPAEALRYVAGASGASPTDVRTVAVARDPWARIWPKLGYALRMPSLAMTRIGVGGRFAAIGDAVAAALGQPAGSITVRRVEHHLAHMASSFLVSPFDQAALFSIDGMGDFASAAWGVGRGNRLYPAGWVRFPHSLGILYSALTQYLGFTRYGDEYKVMGLASYGEPEFLDEFRRMVTAPNHGEMHFRLGTEYFVHHRSGAAMTWERGEPLLGRLYSDYLVERLGQARAPEAEITAREHNIAASLQRRLEEVVIDRLRSLQRATGMRQLCLAGGVAFNCVTNGKIIGNTGFDEVYIQSAAGDAGLAIGAALYLWNHELGNPRSFVMDHSYWGPAFSDEAIAAILLERRGELERSGCELRRIDDDHQLCRFTAERIARGEIVGWFQGRMEWGPRALGNRSILADPRRPEMREILNRKIKRREPFRPFAPSIIEQAAGEYFESAYPSPFMLMARRVRESKRAILPATTHVDGSGRLQTVNRGQNPLYYLLLSEFARQSGVPALLNTSFNENEPVVRAPEEALGCFLRTRMDVLVMGHHVAIRRPAAALA